MESLRKATGLPLFELPTLPPSLLGMRQRIQLRHRFEKLGGLMMNGDSALKAHFHGNKVARFKHVCTKRKKLRQSISS